MATMIAAAPVLESGDRLTRQEFHQAYLARPDIKKSELVQGVVYVASPVSLRRHGAPQSLLVMWVQVYAGQNPSIVAADNATVRLSEMSEVQPDALLFWSDPHRSAARETDDDYIEGAPEFVAEVAASSASYDLHDKKEAYRRAGVQEYLVWRVLDGRIDWFRLGDDGAYFLIQSDAAGVTESVVFPGLRLNVAAMLAGDAKGVLAALGIRL